jgi:hypothetical protein
VDGRLIVSELERTGRRVVDPPPLFVLDSVMDDDTIIDTPEGPKRWGDWKKKNPVQVPSRRTKGKDLPNKVKIRTDE